MLKLLLLLCLLLAICAAGIVAKKIYKTQRYVQKMKRYQAPEKQPNITLEAGQHEEPAELIVDAYEQELFDDIAALFFQESHDVKTAEDAQLLQAAVLRKMPVNSKTQIRHMDLGEHSIFWNFYDQSLEYYMGKYGVFYTHVDRFGEEHKKDIRSSFKL